MGLFDLLNGIASARSQERMDAVEPPPAIPGQPTGLQEITDSAVAGGLNPNEVDEMSRPYFPTDQQPESQPAVASTINSNSVIPEGASSVPNVSSQPVPESPLSKTLSQGPVLNSDQSGPHFVGTPTPEAVIPEVTPSSSNLPGTAIPDEAMGPEETGQASPISAPFSQEPLPTASIAEPPDAVNPNPAVPAVVSNLESLGPVDQQAPQDTLSVSQEPTVPKENEPVKMTKREFLIIAAKMFDEIQGSGLQSMNNNQESIPSSPDLPKAA